VVIDEVEYREVFIAQLVDGSIQISEEIAQKMFS